MPPPTWPTDVRPLQAARGAEAELDYIAGIDDAGVIPAPARP